GRARGLDFRILSKFRRGSVAGVRASRLQHVSEERKAPERAAGTVGKRPRQRRRVGPGASSASPLARRRGAMGIFHRRAAILALAVALFGGGCAPSSAGSGPVG